MAKFQIALGMFGLHNMFEGDARGYIKAAELADAAGIDLVCFTDHVVMGENTDRYPYGPFPLPPIVRSRRLAMRRMVSDRAKPSSSSSLPAR